MNKNRNGQGVFSPLGITLIYLAVATLWIVFTDLIIDSTLADTGALTEIQTYKGLFYVVLTSLGLYFLLQKYRNRLTTREEELKGLYKEHSADRELIDILFERIPVMITIYDPNLENFEVNKEFEKVTGWGSEDVQKLNLFKACYPDIELREEVVEFMNNPGIGWKEFTMNTRSGETIETSWTNIRLTDNTSVGIGIDMTETKASEARLRESRELLENIIESLDESVILVEPETRKILNCNRAAEQIFGYSRDELIGESTRILHLSEEKFREFDEIGAESLRKEGTFSTSYKMRKKNGEVFYSDHTIKLIHDDEGKVDRAVSVVRDVTEQKQNEQELKRRQKRLLRSQKIGKIGDWEFDPESEAISWSPMMYEIFERDKKLGPPPFEELQSKYYGQDSQKHNEHVQKALKQGESYDIDLQLRTEKGSRKYIRAIGIPVKDEQGTVTELTGTVQDITERKMTEIERKKLSDIVQKSQNEIYVFDAETLRFEFVNKGALDNIGYSLEEMLQMTPMDIKPEFDRPAFEENLIPVLKGEKEKIEFETVQKRADGSIYDVEVHTQLIETVGKPLLVAIVLDITEKKKAREKVISSIIEGEDRERKRIASELHDGIGQYLSAANMNLEAVKKDIVQLGEKKRTQFSKGLNLLKQSISEIRNISYNLMPKAIEDYGLVTAVEALIENYESGTDVSIRFKSNLEDSLTEQQQLNIYRIIQEIVNNAIKYADCKNISIQLYREKEMMDLTIEDDGKGVNFYDSEIENGMGLKSIRSRAKALSATLTFDSMSEKGTVVTLEIPLEPKRK